MLVLTRKPGEAIMIGDQMELVVLAVEGESVRIGIRAPRTVGIHRKEVYELIQQSNREAAEHLPGPERLAQLMGNGETEQG
jgi:carbon storage regulator